ncbi:MAG TPA: DUF123 domain-containing protein [Lentisphaeria bacterium]|nr:MAG: hypothetical protein A2X48_18360 [Lentisphaerae bacterium GWF2_49_21]HBC87133.1 DUF123 domain-containing protein [Lentisphaeria bacterium]
MKGIYILVVNLQNDSKIRIGSMGIIPFRKGTYAYVGSAMGGLEARIRRHLRTRKKLHWHIDYLLKRAVVMKVLVKGTSSKSEECRTAGLLQSFGAAAVEDFGSSDCKCASHLFYFNSIPELQISNFTKHENPACMQ